MADRDYHMGEKFKINDYDDERTLDEEEAMEGSEDSHNELSNLQKEGDMPLKDLLAMYGYGDHSTENSNSSDRLLLPGGSEADPERRVSDKTLNDDEEEEENDDDEDADEEEEENDEPDLKQFYTEMLIKRDKAKSSEDIYMDEHGARGASKDSNLNGSMSKAGENSGESIEGRADEVDGKGQRSADLQCHSNVDGCLAGGDGNTHGVDGVDLVAGGIGGGPSRLLRSVSRPQSEEEEDDCDYSPDEEEWKKTIMVGSDYQAAIPEGLCRYDDALPYENEDKMLWDPSHIPEDQTEKFLGRAQMPAKSNQLPTGPHIRDDEQALYLLLQCGYNLEEALRRRRMNVVLPTDTVSLWSEEECHNFESGLRTYGKDFHLIQKNKVRTRSVGELVQFYYLWKKTERHDIFTYKARLEKKKYALHPGITDYMDRFLEEQEGVRDRSSSPNVHCLMMYGDAKRQRAGTSFTSSEDIKAENLEVGKSIVDSSSDPNGPLQGTHQVLATPLASAHINATSASPAPVNLAVTTNPSIATSPGSNSRSQDYAQTMETGEAVKSMTLAASSRIAQATASSAPIVTNNNVDTSQLCAYRRMQFDVEGVHDSQPPENVLSHLPP